MTRISGMAAAAMLEGFIAQKLTLTMDQVEAHVERIEQMLSGVEHRCIILGYIEPNDIPDPSADWDNSKE